MHILFVDESGTPPPMLKQDETPFFVLGGVVVPEDFWHHLAADLFKLKSHFRITDEIKWRYFAQSKQGAKQNSLSHLTAIEKEDLRSKLYEILRTYRSVRLISVVTNVKTAYALDYINNPDDLYCYS